MNGKSFNEWMDWLQSRANPNHIKLGLERLQPLVQKLGLNSFNCPVITVTGTNGKGSTLSFLETYLSQQGAKVGLYSSPHFLCYTERVRINQASVSKAQFCEAFEVIEASCKHEALTYFEIGTLVALYLFKQQALDYILLEVGMGGRLDAVNCVDADIAVMTNVALDHMDFLGDTLESIAYEKAGIFKPTTQYVVLGHENIPCVANEQAKVLKTVCYQKDKDYCININKTSWSLTSAQSQQTLNDLPYGDLAVENIATAIQVLMLLPNLNVTIDKIKACINAASLPGRYQKISEHPDIILDVAHNPAACELLVKKLKENPVTGKNILVFSALGDKNVVQMARILAPIVDKWVLVGISGERGQSAEKLSTDISADRSKVVLKSKVGEGIQAALSYATEYDRIVITGSFYMAGEAKIFLNSQKELEIGSI